MKINNCCICFSVQTGAHIIGVLMVLGVLGELNHEFNPLRWLVKLAAAATYIFMVYKDSALSRQIFFFGWLGSIVGMILANIITADTDDPELDKLTASTNFDEIGRQTCESMEEEERKAAHFKDMKDCIEQVS